MKFPEPKFIIEIDECLLHFAFNADETSLSWKQIPSCMFSVCKKKKKKTGFKAATQTNSLSCLEETKPGT